MRELGASTDASLTAAGTHWRNGQRSASAAHPACRAREPSPRARARPWDEARGTRRVLWQARACLPTCARQINARSTSGGAVRAERVLPRSPPRALPHAPQHVDPVAGSARHVRSVAPPLPPPFPPARARTLPARKLRAEVPHFHRSVVSRRSRTHRRAYHAGRITRNGGVRATQRARGGARTNPRGAARTGAVDVSP